MTNPDPQSVPIMQVVFACAVVIGLLALLAFGLKLAARRNLPFLKSGSRRMQVVESMNLDIRRRLVIVRCDETEHLLLLGGDRDLVVVENLKTGDSKPLSTKDSR